MEEKETLDKIIEAARELGIEKHPGFKDILTGCTAWGLNLENAEIKEVNNGGHHYLLLSEKLRKQPGDGLWYNNENMAIVEKRENDIELRIIQRIKEIPIYKQEDGREMAGSEKEYNALKETRIINENGIETKRILEKSNIDNVAKEKITVERRGLQEVFYKKENGNKTITSGIGAINYYPKHNSYYQKLDYTEPPQESVYFNSVPDERLRECFKHLTEKQREGLMYLDNSSFEARQIVEEEKARTR